MEPGQTLWRVCKAYGVDMQLVAELNNIEDLTQIEKGTMIFIPGATKPLKVDPFTPPDSRQKKTSADADSVIKTFRGKFVWPLSGRITRQFGMDHRIKHTGIDIAVPTGTPVAASASGKVAFKGALKGYGNVVIVKHSEDFMSVYAHLDTIAVEENAYVGQREVIGTAGTSGRTDGPHLHFEIRYKNEARNPLFYLPQKKSDSGSLTGRLHGFA